MTVSSAVNRNDYAGNGSTTSFAVSFRFLQNSDIKATLRDALSTETLQVETTDYTLTGAGDAGGGTLVMIVAPPSGTTLTIQRDVPATQETDYVENDEFPAESHEDALDKLTMLVQQQGEDSTRHIGFSDTVSDATGTAVELSQDATQRADKFLGFDSAGNIVTKTASVAGLVDQGQQDKRYGPTFATVAAMTAANPVSIDGVVVTLVAGMLVHTEGRFAAGDKGHEIYLVAASQTVDELSSFTADNGTVLILQSSGATRVSSFGAIPGRTTAQIATSIQSALDTGDAHIDLGSEVLAFTQVSITTAGQRVFNGSFTAGEFLVTTADNVWITGVSFDYNFVLSGSTTIDITGSQGVTISECFFTRLSTQFPVRFSGSSVTVTNNRIINTAHGIENVQAANAGDVAAKFNANVNITNNTIHTVAGSAINLVSIASNDGWAIANTVFGTVLISGNDIKDITGFGTVFRGSNLTYVGNTIDNATAPTFQGTLITVIGNTLRDILTIGLDFGNVRGGAMIGNIINRCELAGIELNACDKVSVIGNYVEGAASTTPALLVSSGIWLHGSAGATVPAGDCTNITVANNNIKAGSNVYGIAVQDTATTAYLSGNELEGSATTTEIVSQSANVLGFANPNNFAFTTGVLFHVGTLTVTTYPTS